jgi:uncharacterized protein YdaU (DUF1376 family)
MPRPKTIFTGSWYPWYVNDVLTSERVGYLSLTEEGAYRRALDYAWKEGSVPADPRLLAKSIGKGCSSKVAEVVLKMFTPHPKDPSRMINKKLEQTRKTQEAAYKKHSKAGKEGMKKRWDKKRNEKGAAKTTNETQPDLTATKTETSRDNAVITPKYHSDKDKDKEKKESNDHVESVPREAAQKTPPATLPVEVFLGTVEAGLTRRMGLKTLPNQRDWHHRLRWAFANDFSPDDVLECYDLMKAEDWRSGAITAKTLIDNLPNLVNLRGGLTKNGNGKTSGPTSEREKSEQRGTNTRAVAERLIAEGLAERAGQGVPGDRDPDRVESDQPCQLPGSH